MSGNDIPAQDTEALLRRILESSLDGIMALRAVRDATARIIDFEWVLLNARAADLLGRTTDVLLSRRLLAEMPGHLADGLFAEYVEVVETGHALDLEHYYEHERVQMWFHTVAVKLGDGVAVTFADITDRKQLEEQLLHSQKMEVIGRLAGGVAHDFNNLLTAISMNAEMALEVLQRSAAGRPEVEGVLDGVRRAGALTQQLLAFARRQTIKPRVLRMNDLVKHSSAMIRQLLGSNVGLRAVPSTSRWAVAIDPVKFEQVLTNLAVNAHDAMPEGGHFTVEVNDLVVREGDSASIRHVAPGDYVRLEAADIGVGMSPEIIQHIFEPFFTTKGSGLGTGLGLATCYGIVHQAGGAMWATSVVGLGSTFTILLPRSVAEAESWPPAVLPGVPAAGTERVLVVDDDPAVLAVVSRTLARLGYSIAAAGHGEEALDVLDHDGKIDLVLTDVIMPRMGGRELRRAAKRRYPRLPTLLMSAIEAPAPGDDGPILKKPFSSSDLARAVRSALDRGAA